MAYKICSYSKIETTRTKKYEVIYDINNLRIGLIPLSNNPPNDNVIVVDEMIDVGLRLGSEDFFDIEIDTIKNETIVKKSNRSHRKQSFTNQKRVINSTDKVTISDKVILKKNNGPEYNFGKSAYIFWEGKKLRIAKTLTVI